MTTKTTKSSTTAETATGAAKQAADTASNNAMDFASAGADVFKNGVDKAMRSYDDLADFSKANVEAVIQAATTANKGFEAINTSAMSFGRQTFEDGMEAAKAAMSAKSAQEFFDVSSDYMRTTFDAYVNELTKMSELAMTTTREVTEPVNTRMTAMVDMVQNRRV